MIHLLHVFPFLAKQLQTDNAYSRWQPHSNCKSDPLGERPLHQQLSACFNLYSDGNPVLWQIDICKTAEALSLCCDTPCMSWSQTGARWHKDPLCGSPVIHLLHVGHVPVICICCTEAAEPSMGQKLFALAENGMVTWGLCGEEQQRVQQEGAQQQGAQQDSTV